MRLYSLKNVLCIVGCDAICLLLAYIIYICDFAKYFCNIGTLVSLASKRNWAEVGGICLEYDALERNDAQCLGQLAVLVGDYAADAKHEVGELQQLLCLFLCAAEAVEDSAERFVAVL